MSSNIQRGLLTRLLTAKSPDQIEAERRKLEADQPANAEQHGSLSSGDLTLAERLRLEREQSKTSEHRDSNFSSVSQTIPSHERITQPNDDISFIRLPENSSLPEYAPPQSNSLPEAPDLAYRNNSLPLSDSLPPSGDLNNIDETSIDLIASLPHVKGYTKFYNQLTDYLYPQLDPAEQAIHLQLFRLSWGNSKSTCIIGLQRLAERSGMKKTAAQDAVNRLVKKGLIKKLRMVIGKGHLQGIEYYVRPTSSMPDFGRLSENSSLPDNTTIKENKNLKDNTYTDKQVATPSEKTQVGVGSKFTLEECQQYAQHLYQSRQGIINPGGYATTIYRTGEADELIRQFLHPPKPIDITDCPTCKGSGFWYPEGTSSGVAKCKHERLINKAANISERSPERS